MSGIARALMLGCLAVGCSSSTGSTDGGVESAAPSGNCASSCERNDWPRLILGVLYPRSQPSIATVTYAHITDHSGTVRRPVSGGCPSANNFVCTYSWSPSPSDEMVDLEIGISDGATLAREVRLGGFNYCARDIAYVELVMSQAPELEPTRYVSPCSGL